MSNHIWFAASSFHFIERPQFFSMGFQPGLYFSPFKTFVETQVFFKTGFQHPEQVFTLFR